MSKDKEPIKGRIERRTYPGEVNIRMTEPEEGESTKESRTVEGYAAVFNAETDMVLWREKIAPGAFSSSLGDDVRALFNHDPNFVLARSNNTLELWEDEKGLGYRFEAPNTTAGNDLLENLRNGNITQSSFGFTIDTYEWEEREDESDVVTITKVGQLFDVSPVTFPAYETTEVTARSIDKIREERAEMPTDEVLEEQNDGPDTGQQDEEEENGIDLDYLNLGMAELTPPELL